MSATPTTRPSWVSKTTFEALGVDLGDESEEEMLEPISPPESSSESSQKPSKSAIKKAKAAARAEKRLQQKAERAAVRAAAQAAHKQTSIDDERSQPLEASTEFLQPKLDAKEDTKVPSMEEPSQDSIPKSGFAYPIPDTGAVTPRAQLSPQPPVSHASPTPPNTKLLVPNGNSSPTEALRPHAADIENSPENLKQVDARTAEEVKKRRSFLTRTLWTFIMIGGFITLLLMGHAYMVVLVLLCQTLVYREVTALFSLKRKDSGETGSRGRDPWSKTLNWYFFAVTNYFLYGESIIYYFKHVVFSNAQLTMFATNHRFVSFTLYTIGFMGFVMSLKRGYLKQQFGLFCWVHMTLLLIVVSSHFIVNNILEGMIWFWVPASLVICNDVFAYIWGITLGRTPLIKLSPKKTVEGFVGAFFSTIVFGILWGTYFMRFDYMICPMRDLGVSAFSGQLHCTPNPVSGARSRQSHTRRTSSISSSCPALRRWSRPSGASSRLGLSVRLISRTSATASLDTGGMTDRMDCQFLMGVFTYVYYSSLIREHHVTVGSVLQTIVSGLTVSEQLELMSISRGIWRDRGLPSTFEAVRRIVSPAPDTGSKVWIREAWNMENVLHIEWLQVMLSYITSSSMDHGGRKPGLAYDIVAHCALFLGLALVADASSLHETACRGTTNHNLPYRSLKTSVKSSCTCRHLESHIMQPSEVFHSHKDDPCNQYGPAMHLGTDDGEKAAIISRCGKTIDAPASISIMLGVEGYGSDSDNDEETLPAVVAPPKPTPSLAAKLPAPSKKSAFSLPPPSSVPASASTSTSAPGKGLSLPPPKTKKVPKKISIGLPALSREEPDEDDERPAAKRPRLEPGAGSSALLSMLPAPKNKVPVKAVPERVLGAGRGPGLVFNTSSRSSRTTTVEVAEEAEDEGPSAHLGPPSSSILEEVFEVSEKKEAIAFLPPSLVKGKANVSVEETHRPSTIIRPTVSSAPAVDFFSLASTSSTPGPPKSTAPQVTTAPSLPLLPGIFSAPTVDDFVPPEPTPQDPYPGYYLLPSGAWAAYDTDYYKKFYDRWKREYDAHVRALEKGAVKGFEGVEREGAAEVDALKVMEKAKREIQEREEKKALTTGGAEVPLAPKMNIKGAALGGRARTRHQLASLLTEAYQNREALEEQIAQGRRNRKEAGNKYGF
ncbi:putative phosphatidate cytidylyltransferase [Grifola frondosa]|uniref:phosphatidate cytidylyltransferase n=1 Tax=Grifola frondosa TaxID=5627 RepID=A0A1C7MFD2_GRIFR|nr:putative phosphatidate cytidylyltransferase [Grifola frondosa]